MWIVVLDTNVIISAALKSDSKPARIVQDWVLRGPVKSMICPSVAEEYRNVAGYKKFAGHGFPPQWLEDLIQLSFPVPEPPPWPLPLPDLTDGPFLALAYSAGAWLVTGNLKHFPEAARNGVTVVSPAEYLERLG